MKRIANISFIFLFSAFLASVLLITVWHGREKNYSSIENRSLEKAPTLTGESLRDGSWFSDWEAYLLDRAAGRDQLIRQDTLLRMNLLRQPVVNQVVVAENVLLPYYPFGNWDSVNIERSVADVADQFQALQAHIADHGGQFFYVGVPAQVGYYADSYPAYLEHGRDFFPALESAWAQALSDRSIPYVDMTAVYAQMGHPSGYYFTTDHHHTIRGALLTYQMLMDEISLRTGLTLPILREEDLTFVTLSNPMLGSRNRMLYGLYPTDEHLTYAEATVAIPFRRFDNGVEVAPSLFSLPPTSEEPTGYSVFMGGDIGETIIQTDRPELPNVLLVGESYTNAVETLLYASFNETRSLDLRFYGEQSLQDYINDYQPDVVILMRDEAHFIDYDTDALFR